MNNKQHEYHEQVNIYRKYLWYQECKIKKNHKNIHQLQDLGVQGPSAPSVNQNQSRI